MTCWPLSERGWVSEKKLATRFAIVFNGGMKDARIYFYSDPRGRCARSELRKSRPKAQRGQEARMDPDKLLDELREDGYTAPTGEIYETFCEAIERAYKAGQRGR